MKEDPQQQPPTFITPMPTAATNNIAPPTLSKGPGSGVFGALQAPTTLIQNGKGRQTSSRFNISQNRELKPLSNLNGEYWHSSLFLRGNMCGSFEI